MIIHSHVIRLNIIHHSLGTLPSSSFAFLHTTTTYPPLSSEQSFHLDRVHLVQFLFGSLSFVKQQVLLPFDTVGILSNFTLGRLPNANSVTQLHYGSKSSP